MWQTKRACDTLSVRCHAGALLPNYSHTHHLRGISSSVSRILVGPSLLAAILAAAVDWGLCRQGLSRGVTRAQLAQISSATILLDKQAAPSRLHINRDKQLRKKRIHIAAHPLDASLCLLSGTRSGLAACAVCG